MEMIKKLMLVAAMVGTGFVQAAGKGSPEYPYSSSYASFDDNVLPAYTVNDLFNEEDLVKQAYRRFPVGTNHDAWELIYVRDLGPDDEHRYPAFNPGRDYKPALNNLRDAWLRRVKVMSVIDYLSSQLKKMKFSQKTARLPYFFEKDRLTFRESIESKIQKNLDCLKVVVASGYDSVHREYRNNYLGLLINNQAKRIETKQLLTTTIELINAIHTKLESDQKTFSHARTLADKKDIEGMMTVLDGVVERLNANFPYSDES